MSHIAAIDLGSNAIRLIIAEINSDGTYIPVNSFREPVRLGTGVFSTGEISKQAADYCIDSIKKFKQTLDDYKINSYRAVATSAVRESKNQREFVKRVREATGVNLEVIDGQEEARLSTLAVSKKVDLNKSALLVDIGGGSIEFSIALDGRVVYTDSVKMGTVRFIEVLERKKRGVDILKRLSKSYANNLKRRIKKIVGKKEVSIVTASGGTVDTIGSIGRDFFGEKDAGVVSASVLSNMYDAISQLSVDQRIVRFGLRPDRADVILPALIVLNQVVKQSKNKQILVPCVGVKEGILWDLIEQGVEIKKRRLSRDSLLPFAIEIGRRFSFDEEHGKNVAALAMQIFDKTQKLHNLSRDYRVLLEIAGILHDVGNCININSHHKHSQYIIRSTDFYGLSLIQKFTVAAITRYHRKSEPKLEHPEFAALPEEDREAVKKLSSILRIAEGIASEEKGELINIKFHIKPPKVLLKLEGVEDMTLIKVAVIERIRPFEAAFKVKLLVR